MRNSDCCWGPHKFLSCCTSVLLLRLNIENIQNTSSQSSAFIILKIAPNSILLRTLNYAGVFENTVQHMCQTQGPQAKSGLPFLFIWPARSCKKYNLHHTSLTCIQQLDASHQDAHMFHFWHQGAATVNFLRFLSPPVSVCTALTGRLLPRSHKTSAPSSLCVSSSFHQNRPR